VRVLESASRQDGGGGGAHEVVEKLGGPQLALTV
jgi:hypothetical protein